MPLFRYLSSAEIAEGLPEDSYGLIFGANAFFAYCMQSILTAIVASDSFGLNLNIFQQMNVYGGFLAVIGCVYLILLAIFGIRSIKGHSTKEFNCGEVNNIGSVVIERDCINSL